MAHRHVSMRNIMFGYGWNSQNHKNEGQTTTNWPFVSVAWFSDVQKQVFIQLKVNPNNPKLVELSIGMYCWEK